MSNFDFSSLPELPCPLLTQPTDTQCVGTLVRQLTYNLMVMERALLNSVVPAGVPTMFAGCPSNIPNGYVLADGTWYEPTTYPALFAAIGYKYGKRPDGCFRSPDYRSTVFRGMALGDPCFTGTEEWIGFDNDGEVAYGDNVGATKKFCNDDSGDCEHPKSETLVVPLISTGELCL